MKFLWILPFLAFAQIAYAGDLISIRKPILLNYGAYPQLYVTFNHDTHKTVKCRTCHHIADEQGKRFVKCTREECHSLKGAKQRDPLSAFMAYHARDMDRSCYGCHQMERATHASFRGCQPCHMKQMTRDKLQTAQK